MNEFQNVAKIPYVDPLTGNILSLNGIHLREVQAKSKTVDTNGREIDKITYDEMSINDEMLRLCEFNSGYMMERQFEVNKIKQVDIPA